MKPYTYRRRDGKFQYSSDFDRMCNCGHRLGNHTAEHPHECLECDCEKFKLVKVKK